ncbi:protease pro-enzyme activation domain-containing protein [Dyella jiangningensis]|uniref:S53 family peptidase n=1 Tax=Dyella jiangningensis TaxID=1379159 RepID=UPI00240F927C|nr:protease pro-enzyme activation domain-containing protein [Dyella jiangningensis]MDG2537482.1 protease pro-enzyme activation domain-containing protein [Dyella jiangningensis]
MSFTARTHLVRRSEWFAAWPITLSLALCPLSAHADDGWVSTTTPQALLPPPVAGCEYAGSNAWAINSAFYGSVIFGGTEPYCVDASGLAPLDPSKPLHLLISLKLRHLPQLQEFLREVTQPGSSVYGRYLSRAQFQDMYAPTPGQAQAVVAYLRKNGFTNIRVAPNQLLVAADATVGQASKAFHTSMMQWTLSYPSGSESGYGAASPVQVPAALSDIVDIVQGLPGLGHGSKYHASLALPSAPISSSGYSPRDYATIYNADSIAPGSRTPVAIIAQGDMSQTISDLGTFTANHQMATVPTTVIPTAAGALGDGNAQDESQTIVGAAGGLASLAFYTMPNGGSAPSTIDLTWAYNRAVADNAAKIIESSWSVWEPIAYLSGAQAQDDAIFMAAQAQGQVFVVPVGENNDLNWQIDDVYEFPPEPATSPYVVAIGGSQASVGNAHQWGGEALWAEMSSYLDPEDHTVTYDFWYANAGYSLHESVPAWQAPQALTVTSNLAQVPTTQRYVPDLAFDAHMNISSDWTDQDHPAGPASGARIIVGGVEHHLFNGTELSASLFAGLFARIESAHGNALGLPTPQMYANFAKDRSPLHDFSASEHANFYNYNCPTPGWTACYGWGSLDIGKFNDYVTRYWGL